ncbi:hypothetical protein ROLI_005450 [Roseobacter fucihabitans]|uniref:PEP-CTERM protein-sorting domain-containing protein n=1 Tax=Roseobacter fucihabitans TaxID=1537242 RepID=A0ABZ2BN91_9RHOB|nr:VPLPA-CTERM sorting domain-containing protein [Roseobacter litoralis]MBC6964718.1 hypothetical protein [Roseobacter litoralis]
MKITGLALAIAMTVPFAAGAATMSATNLTVNIYQSDNTGNTGNTADAILANVGPANFLGTASFTGILDFDTQDSADTSTIDDWLTSKGGTYTELGAGFDETLKISFPDIGTNSARTTWFEFIGGSASVFDFTVKHDDGVCFYESGVQETCSQTPTQVVTTNGFSYDGGVFQLLYAATNGDPSVLKVTSNDDVTLEPVPLPASALLLMGGLAGLGMMRRRRKS